MTAETGVRSGSTKLPKVAWVVLVVVSVLGVVNHAVGVFAIAKDDPEPLMFALFAGLNLYATAVLLRPYRRGETWAWLITWVKVAAFALVYPLTDPRWARGIWWRQSSPRSLKWRRCPGSGPHPTVSKGRSMSRHQRRHDGGGDIGEAA